MPSIINMQKSNVGSACNAMDCLSTMSPASKHLWTNRPAITLEWTDLSLSSLVGHPSRPAGPYSNTSLKEQWLFNQSPKYQKVIPTNYNCSNLRPSPRKGGFFEEYEEPLVVNMSSTFHFWLQHVASKDEEMDNVLESAIDQPLGQTITMLKAILPSRAPQGSMWNIMKTAWFSLPWGWINTTCVMNLQVEPTKISSYDSKMFLNSSGHMLTWFLHQGIYWRWCPLNLGSLTTVNGFDILMNWCLNQKIWRDRLKGTTKFNRNH